MRVLPFLLMPVLAACTSTEEKVAHNEAQIRMIAVQREAQKEEREAAAEAQKQLYISLQKVAEADPSQAGVVAMALAMQGMQGRSNEQPNTPIVQLQARQDRALQWAQALSPVAGGLITTLGVSAINASVQKQQIAANRDIQTNSQNQHAAVVGSVAALGREALVNAGDNYAGDVYTLSDQAYIDQSTSTVTTNTTTSTTTQTVTDSYNTDSYNATDSSTSIADSYNSTTDTTLNNTVTSTTTVTWGGAETTLGDLLTYLAGLGSPYSLTINGVMVASSTEGEGETEAVTCVPDFSPSGYNCTGG